MTSAAPVDVDAPIARGAFIERAGVWFWLAVLVGAVLRIFLSTQTRGTADVGMWGEHALGVAAQGAIGHYRLDDSFNHPPAMGYFMSWIARWSGERGLAFGVVYRTLFAVVDLVNVGLIVRVLAGSVVS